MQQEESMSNRNVESLLPNKRSRNTSWLWMFFSTIWVGILVGSAITYWNQPGDRPWDPDIALGWRLLAIALVIAFIGIYAYTVWRMYFQRTSWLVVFERQEAWLIRGSLTTLAIAMNLLPSGDSANWQIAFMFVAIAWALTSNHQHAFSSVFQAAAIAAVTLLATGRGDVLPGTMLYIIGFGVMVAGYVMNNGLLGQLVVERGRVRDQAVTEERFRLARDLHDTVGHSMTQITLKAELARRLLPDDPGRAADEMEQIEQLSRTLSAEVRASIAGDTSLTLAQEIDRASELLKSMDIEVSITGTHENLPERVADTFAWCLREGVMNVVKHSGADRCEIGFSESNRFHVLKITDNGKHPANDGHKGQGMSGMKQRVNELDGDLEFRATDSGHSLTIRIPA